MRLIPLVVAFVFASLTWAEENPIPQPTPTTPAMEPAKPEPVRPATPPATPTVTRPPLPRHAESSPADTLSRVFPGLGVDSKTVFWDMFPLGLDKRFVTMLQVGSIENPGGSDSFSSYSGWPVEELLKVSPDEAKALQAVRTEYDAERKKLEDQVNEFQKAQAEKLKALRFKFEAKANEALAPESREAKQKFDALREELVAKKKALVTEAFGADGSSFQPNQSFGVIGRLREQMGKIAGEYEPKFLELLPAEVRPKVESVFKQQAATRERMNRIAPPRPGGPVSPPLQGQNVKPPQPPSQSPPPAPQPAVQPPQPPKQPAVLPPPAPETKAEQATQEKK